MLIDKKIILASSATFVLSESLLQLQPVLGASVVVAALHRLSDPSRNVPVQLFCPRCPECSRFSTLRICGSLLQGIPHPQEPALLIFSLG